MFTLKLQHKTLPNEICKKNADFCRLYSTSITGMTTLAPKDMVYSWCHCSFVCLVIFIDWSE